jgi:hypothetical protein
MSFSILQPIAEMRPYYESRKSLPQLTHDIWHLQTEAQRIAVKAFLTIRIAQLQKHMKLSRNTLLSAAFLQSISLNLMLSPYSLFRVRKRTKQNLSPSTEFLIITEFARAAVTGRWHTCSYSLCTQYC